MRGVTISLCALSVVASAQENPLTWFPLQVGSRRVYEHEWKSGDRSRPGIDRWTTEETITGWATIPEGIVVLRDVKQTGRPGRRGVSHGILLSNGARQVNNRTLRTAAT